MHELLVSIDDIKIILNLLHDEEDMNLFHDLQAIQVDLLDGRRLEDLTEEDRIKIANSMRLTIRDTWTAQEEIKLSEYTKNQRLNASGGYNI